jgi:hypothetical protein
MKDVQTVLLPAALMSVAEGFDRFPFLPFTDTMARMYSVHNLDISLDRAKFVP